MKARLEVGHRVYTPGSLNSHGKRVATWADSVPLLVFTIAPGPSSEPRVDGDGTTTVKHIYAPPDTAVGSHDLIVIDGKEWEVAGDVADWTRGTFGARLGVVFDITREAG